MCAADGHHFRVRVGVRCRNDHLFLRLMCLNLMRFVVNSASRCSYGYISLSVYWTCLLSRFWAAWPSKHADVGTCVQNSKHVHEQCVQNITIDILNTCRVDLSIYSCSSWDSDSYEQEFDAKSTLIWLLA